MCSTGFSVVSVLGSKITVSRIAHEKRPLGFTRGLFDYPGKRAFAQDRGLESPRIPRGDLATTADGGTTRGFAGGATSGLAARRGAAAFSFHVRSDAVHQAAAGLAARIAGGLTARVGATTGWLSHATGGFAACRGTTGGLAASGLAARRGTALGPAHTGFDTIQQAGLAAGAATTYGGTTGWLGATTSGVGVGGHGRIRETNNHQHRKENSTLHGRAPCSRTVKNRTPNSYVARPPSHSRVGFAADSRLIKPGKRKCKRFRLLVWVPIGIHGTRF
jgi:hypothetical protein